MYVFKSLENESIKSLAATWNLAFSDYVVDMAMEPHRLEAYFMISGVDYSKSYGAYSGDELVGMLMNSIDIYKGKTVAYDAMTGVVPAHRGKGLFSELFEYTRKTLRDSGVTHYYLEVIQTNKRAYDIYSAKGGKVEREYTFLKGKAAGIKHNEKDGEDNIAKRKEACNTGVNVLSLSDFPAEEICTYEPSFSNRVSAMLRNAGDYQVAFINSGERIGEHDERAGRIQDSFSSFPAKAAAVFNTMGRITQVMYGGPEDKAGLGAIMSYLARDFEELEISNIPSAETCLINDLRDIGFEVLVEQYEMSFVL